ncbi:MAG: thioredoxin domain-containing protein [Desulfobacterales bacterium]
MAPNYLINEKSPYLIQHANNPVDWYPWCDEAFEKAKLENKPVFLSVGYSACHWCHVMERESFEDEEAAGYLNDTFICVKVDREERPDIDSVYMAACQLLTGRGGWPLTVFLTPDKRPFFAATYIPKNSRFKQPGLIDICKQVKNLWEQNRDKILESAVQISEHMGKAFDFDYTAEELDASALKAAYEQLENSFDEEYAGFGAAPKFPTPHRMLFLLRYFYRTGEEKALIMVQKTLKAMRLGGIWDHVGFGFHRYSTDQYWLLPHFEKMLYDQALLAMAYLEAYQVTRDPFYAKTADDIFTYVLRDMTSSAGGFFTAEDADSEGEEGKFYVWTTREFNEILGAERGKLWERFMTMNPQGNFSDEATGQKTGTNILHLTRSFTEWAAKLEMEESELADRWEKTRETLFHIRKQRVAPLKDDKILTDWNGLMITALAMGARILGNYAYAEAAKRAVSFIQRRLTDENGTLFHRFREDQAGIHANAGDYAFLIQGLIELFRSTFEPEYIRRAVELQKQMMENFWDNINGGFYLTSKLAENLPARPKELYDGAIPSANSVAFSNMLMLSRLTGDIQWEENADEMAKTFSGTVKNQPSAFTYFLNGLELAVAESHELLIAGELASPDTDKMISVLDEKYTPNLVLLVKTSKNAEQLAQIAPFTEPLKPLQGKATAYVCTGFSCSTPITDPNEFASMLEDKVNQKHSGKIS